MNYKSGDKVLVEAEIVEVSNIVTGYAPYKISFKNNSNTIFIRASDIHSLAPEFKVGEPVEISFDQKAWGSGYFFVATTKEGNLLTVEKPVNYIIRPYIRKPQPDDTMIWKDGKRYKLVEAGDE